MAAVQVLCPPGDDPNDPGDPDRHDMGLLVRYLGVFPRTVVPLYHAGGH